MTGPGAASRTAAGGLTGMVLGPLLGADLHRPRLTVYGLDGARTELSTASLANWSAKVAGLLADELGVRPGDRVSVLLPAGWQTAPVLFGAWWVGAVLTGVDDPDAVAAFVADGSDAAAEEVFVVSGHPLGAPSRTVAAHQRDFTTAVLPQADRFAAGANLRQGDPVLCPADRPDTPLVLADLAAATATAAAQLGPGPRLLSDRPWTFPDGLVTNLLGPLAAGGSLVQVPEGSGTKAAAAAGAPDPTAVAAAERVSLTQGPVVAGVDALPGSPAARG